MEFEEAEGGQLRVEDRNETREGRRDERSSSDQRSGIVKDAVIKMQRIEVIDAKMIGKVKMQERGR